MKEGAFSFLKTFQNFGSKINTKVENIKTNIGEGVDVLKNVAYEIKSEISSQEKINFQVVANHLMRFLILLLNQAATEIRSINKYLSYDALTQFKNAVF